MPQLKAKIRWKPRAEGSKSWTAIIKSSSKYEPPESKKTSKSAVLFLHFVNDILLDFRQPLAYVMFT